MKEKQEHACEIDLSPCNNKKLANLCGRFDEHIRQIEQRLKVDIHLRGQIIQIRGEKHDIKIAKKVILSLYSKCDEEELTPNHVHLSLQEYINTKNQNNKSSADTILLQLPLKKIVGRNKNQNLYMKYILENDITFGIGPAGTGKSYLAVAVAAYHLMQNNVKRILLIRPAVEAGENLGFLPGDLIQKVEPYLRPLYDALYDMINPEQVNKFIEQGIIEIAPLAYMRGRTLNESFIILDESQNATIKQMKMLLTRLGFDSKLVITGDVTQVDLPKGQYSGLKHASEILQNIPNIKFFEFEKADVVRHPIIQKIISAYEKDEQEKRS